MGITLQTSDGPLVISEAAIQAAARHAELCADLTAAYLEEIGLLPATEDQQTRPFPLPANFLLELAAALRLGMWELHDIRAHIEAGLPSHEEATTDLAARAAKGHQEFEGPAAAPLSRQVASFWLHRYAWDGLPMMGADILVGDVDEEEMAELMAEFIWTNRKQLAKLAQKTGESK